MRVKVISRNPDDYLRQTKRDIHKVPRNYDPGLHPFEAPREYVRALNAVKLERVFAKPFVGCLDGHSDGVSCIGKHPKRLSLIGSGAFDGEIRLWNLPTLKCTKSFVAHEGYVRQICFLPDGERFMTVGDDKTIKTWRVDDDEDGSQDPIDTVLSRSMITHMSHHRVEPLYATCGEVCQLWEETRSEPIRTLQWGVDTLHHVAFNQVEKNLLGCCASDRSIILYDTREFGPLRKVVMELRSNALCWNPMEAFIFTVANEDYNLYSYDTRKLNSPINVHKDHVSAVIDVDYSPTGREFVSASYDKTVRIFTARMGHSRDIYHTKRMQRLTSVRWSLDNKYILSGSDEMNIRIWKAKASEKLGALKPREKAALNYSEALKEKFAAHPQIKRIARHRQVPKHVLNAKREHAIIHKKNKRKEANRRKHSKEDTVPHVPERRKHIVKVQE